MYRIIVNCYKNRLRSPWWNRSVNLSEKHQSRERSANPQARHTARHRIKIAMSVLSSGDRALVVLFELQGWSLEELGRLTGKTPGSLKTRLSRLRLRMRKRLIQYLKGVQDRNWARTLSSEDEICVVVKPGKDLAG